MFSTVAAMEEKLQLAPKKQLRGKKKKKKTGSEKNLSEIETW